MSSQGSVAVWFAIGASSHTEQKEELQLFTLGGFQGMSKTEVSAGSQITVL